jgi:drug/metabolite transporter (DMT)-like permease
MTLSMASLFLNILFLSSIEFTESLSATIIMELWPFFALIFAATLIQKSWDGLNLRNLVLFCVGAIGLTLLAAEESGAFEGGGHRILTEWDEIPIGTLLALAAAVLSGLTIVQTRLYYTLEKSPSFSGAAYTIFLCRAISIPVAFGLMLAFGDNVFAAEAMLWGVLFGMIPYGLASMLAISGIRYSKNIGNIMLWYFAPILAGLWLLAFTEQNLSDIYILAFLPIVFANIFTNVSVIRRKSFFIMSIAIMIFGVYIYLGPTQEYNRFYDAITVLMAFYAIFISFIIQRKVSDLREIAKIVSECVAALAPQNIEKHAIIAAISCRLTGRDLREEAECSDADYERLAKDCEVDRAAQSIIMERTTSLSLSENMIIIIITACILFISLFLRPHTAAADLVALVSSISSVFLTAFTIELSQKSFQWRLATESFYLPYHLTQKLRETTVLSILSLCILLSAILVLLTDKHLIDIVVNELPSPVIE